jgi:tetratricopeptide (TPR) repeat protein
MPLKTLAPFVVVCLGLLAFLAWELNLLRGDAANDAESRAKDRPSRTALTELAPSADTVETAEASNAIDTTPPNKPEKLDQALRTAATAPATQTAVGQPPAASAATTQSAVRWATDLRRRVKQRFISLRERLVSEPRDEAALKAALELARELQWHNEACDLLGRLVQLRPEDATLRFELATELMRLERWLEAIPQLRSVIERQPENARAWYNLAIAHQALGHLHDAQATWDRVIELMSQNPDAYAHRGEVRLDLRDWSAAAADFETALRLEPESIDAAMNLSLALSKLGRFGEARETLLPLLEQHPQHVPALNRMAEIAWALYEGDPVANQALSHEAVSFCLRSLAVDADQPEIKTLLRRASTAGD